MTETAATAEFELQVTASELDLVLTALRMLRWTLGRDEAEELEEVQVLIRRFEVARAG